VLVLSSMASTGASACALFEDCHMSGTFLGCASVHVTGRSMLNTQQMHSAGGFRAVVLTGFLLPRTGSLQQNLEHHNCVGSAIIY
jgi:hypothetical protein